ncbi:MAG: alpha-2-macroglobulin family protein, partial [Gammaproteobacteria bacterium]
MRPRYWKPDLETDADGRAQFSFTAPDNLTGSRVLVMALTDGAAMGLGQSTVRVNLPLQLAPALPNQLHVGDAFSAGFDVTNRTPAAQQVQVAIDAQGAARGQSATQLELASYAHGLAWLNLAANKPGDITLLATARAGKLGDALQQTIPVTVAGTREVAAEYGSTTGAAASVPIELPANALPGSGRLSVDLAPTALANLAGAFAHMRADPLRTWEVSLSRSVMAADYLALKEALPSTVQWPGAQQQITDTLQHAADFQAPNGSMAFWIPRDEFVSPWLSVYTDLAFDWLSAAGYKVPATVQAALDGYLENQVLNSSNSGGGPAAPVLAAGALAALAMH